MRPFLLATAFFLMALSPAHAAVDSQPVADIPMEVQPWQPEQPPALPSARDKPWATKAARARTLRGVGVGLLLGTVVWAVAAGVLLHQGGVEAEGRRRLEAECAQTKAPLCGFTLVHSDEMYQGTGYILVALAGAHLVSGIPLVAVGEHRLRAAVELPPTLPLPAPQPGAAPATLLSATFRIP